MGASAWFYLVPHEKDVAAALEALRWDILRSGQYAKGSTSSAPFPSYEEWIADMPPDYVADMEDPRAEHAALARRVTLAPNTPNEALEEAAEDGTHSAIDIIRVSDAPMLGAISPMPEAKRIELFGSARPSRGRVEAAQHAIGSPAGRWSGYWLAVYADDSEDPRWLCFAGISGD